MAKQFTLLSALLHVFVLTLEVNGGHQVYTILAHCNGENPCLNLSVIAANTSYYLKLNTTLIFQQGGRYHLDREFSVSDEEILELSGDPASADGVSIFCRDDGRLKFGNISQLSVRSLNFVGCSATIEQVDQLILDNCSFDGKNVASSALQLSQVNVEISGSTFASFTVGTYRNSVQFLDEVDHPYSLVHVESYDARIGGALVATNSSLTITNTHFVFNSAQVGGAMFVELCSSITIDNCTFLGNSATNCTDDRCIGGALFIDRSCLLTAQNSIFENNTSDFSGGAIALFRATFEDTQNKFNHNTARNFGGGIFAHFDSSISSNMSKFTRNEADFSGGVMYADYLSSISIKNGDFHYNEATMTMCTVPGSSIGTAIHLDNACFDSEAGFGGGALYARFGSIIAVEDSTFSGNKAENDGGVIYATSNSSITVEGSTFDGNSARYGGGVLHAYYYSSIAVKNSNFSDNVAENVGGVFHIFYSSTLSVEGGRFYENSAGYVGGVLHAFYLSTVVIKDSLFYHNNASYFGGVVYANYICNITVYRSTFRSNRVNADGGAIFAYDNNTITIDSSEFDSNEAGGNGGGVYSSHLSQIVFRNGCRHSRNSANEGGGVIFTRDDAPFTDFGSSFVNNWAEINGGSICINDGDIRLKESNFVGNSAPMYGGAINLKGIAHWAMIEKSVFSNNSAMNGAAISMHTNDNNYLNMSGNVFSFNSATGMGGALYLAKGNNLTSNGDSFFENAADQNGGVFYLKDENRLKIQDGNFSSNRAEGDGGVLYSQMKTDLEITGEECSFIANQARNGGAICAKYSTVKLNAEILFMVNNTANGSGGALHLSRSNLISFCSNLGVVENQARDGGAVHATDSDLQMSNSIKIGNNFASYSGGGIYLMSSTLKVSGYDIYITNNMADLNGGGLHASNSTIMINGTVHFISNSAWNGGGISMEGNDRLHGSALMHDTLNFSSNFATNHGGAIYVNDMSTPEFCAKVENMATTECFFSSIFLNFENNRAAASGDNLFGGFLDRCKPRKYSEDNIDSNTKGLESLYKSSNIETNDTISSYPVQVCFCRNGIPDCMYELGSLQVQTEREFSVEIIAYDQVTHGVNATFDCSLESSSGLRRDQMIQHVGTTCTKLNFNLEQITMLGIEKLLLSVRGPCRNTNSSDRHVSIDVTCYCPRGFQKANREMCQCVCNEVLRPYRVECDIETQSIRRNDKFWITYIEHDERNEGYLIYPNCPFDYCHPRESNITINLNFANGSDAQCASNRAGILCGTCQPGLSVSLGSSRCLSCPKQWPWLVVAIVLAFIVAGIALVILLLVLNLTVAVGTLNAIIFYANIVAANRSVVFHTSEISFATVVISWLNFDIGFDACFYNGMDTFVKTWLQLAFPFYIIILVVVIIKLSSISDTFGHLIGKKDPVATLATLVLLSYTKFLQTIITAFSNAILVYPDNSRRYVWLPDATVNYITSKHALLFVVAILILLIGLIYTLLLFSWRWFLCCPTKRVKWIRNQKLVSFMEMYLIPYTPKHRYWTGLLLLVRVSIYLVSAFNPSSDPRVTLSSTIFIMSFLFLYIAMFGVRMYKCWFTNAMETFTYFNLIALSIFTWYTTDAGGNQEAVMNISVGITFIQLLAVLVYHVLRYANHRLYSRLEASMVIVKLKKYAEIMKQKLDRTCANESQSKRDENTLQADEVLKMVDRPQGGDNTSDSKVISNNATSSSTVVEMSKSDFV